MRQRNRPSVRRNSRAAEKNSASLTAEEEALMREIMAEPMDYMDSPEFRVPGAEKKIYEKPAAIRFADVTWYRPLIDQATGGKPGERKHKKEGSVLLTAAQERVIFLQFNYARYRVRLLQDELAGRTPTTEQAREILRWHRTARGYRAQIAEINLALVLAMAKRVPLGESDYADLIGEGNMALMRSVDKFDCGRGFKFSTYGCRAILKAFSRFGIKLQKYRQRFPGEFDPQFERSNHLELLRSAHEKDSAAEVRYMITRNSAELSDVEQKVIFHRFGLDAAAPQVQLTLEQVGQMIGVTKERVRQIQNRALEKLKDALITLRGERPPLTHN
ncbi:MAG: sigma-70 family RNA polymerase sigma factor [Planctomycetes bacterium]|nr:sigma-70 family RNA polymerase sigma factor [Planctomycetota bacterium]